MAPSAIGAQLWDAKKMSRHWHSAPSHDPGVQVTAVKKVGALGWYFDWKTGSGRSHRLPHDWHEVESQRCRLCGVKARYLYFGNTRRL
jgi:hypothetical protein